MEKRQYELCLEVLRRLDKSGALKNMLLIGSWCLPFYKEYFAGLKYGPVIKTRDIDFLIPNASRIKTRIDMVELLKDLGFVIGYKGSKGYMRLEHPDLIIELLVPEKGRGSDRPYPLPNLGLNAQPLRFLSFLTQKTISIRVEGISITLPHPANFALHKLIISSRRRNTDKRIKDRETALQLLKTLMDKKESAIIAKAFNSIPQKWQKTIVQELEKVEESLPLDREEIARLMLTLQNTTQ